MDPGFMQGLHKSMVFISILFASHLHRYCAFCTCGGAFWCQYVCMLWWATIREGIIVFLLGWVATRGHSQPQTQQINAQIPLWKLCCIFVCEIFTKIPLIARQVQTVLWRKSKFVRWGNPSYSLEKIQICELGKSFWLGGCPGCWIIAGGWFQSQHCRPNFHYQFVTNNTIHSCCMLIIYFSVTPISLRYTSIIQNQRTPLVHSLHYIW